MKQMNIKRQIMFFLLRALKMEPKFHKTTKPVEFSPARATLLSTSDCS